MPMARQPRVKDASVTCLFSVTTAGRKVRINAKHRARYLIKGAQADDRLTVAKIGVRIAGKRCPEAGMLGPARNDTISAGIGRSQRHQVPIGEDAVGTLKQVSIGVGRRNFCQSRGVIHQKR